ncbi:hypothetical protein OHB26_29705 [Nocardia sp. NBC_01503]|uniref:hypothetical protein n=1 Tax=Nocardia sp. NBC_01503 TaxID=2975997 RepID=UPI002E7C1893|nr:hypothetical protein [Nocardia sp. NBC_01503]WTL31061.1 hypothetical protein OHB26_29705 [Nocardia sp. NBC_01503]
MNTLLPYLVVIAAVFALNLLPAFGPPTWILLIVFRLNWQLNPIALVMIGAFTAGIGRQLLAMATARLGDRLSAHRRESLRAAGDYLTGHKGRSLAGLTLFLLSPLPSAQMFEAAGLIGIRLLPLTAAFVAGRLVSYSLYMGATGIAERSFGEAFTNSLTSPYSIAIQVVVIVAVIALARIDWTRYIPAADRHGDNVRVPRPRGNAAPCDDSDL